MTDQLQISYSLSNIEQAAHQFWQYLHQYRIFAFSGDMGAGKTTFIRALCSVMGVHDTVSSPTFALINEYRADDQVIFHMDWYRLKDTEEAIQAGIEDCLLRKDAICLIEWPEKAPELLPKPYLWVDIRSVNELERKIEVKLV